MKKFRKQPQDLLDFDVDMEGFFKDIFQDEITRVVVTVACDSEPVPALEVGPSPHAAVTLLGNNPHRFKLWVGGGTSYCDYVVTCVVYTQQDRQKEVELMIKVVNL